MSTRLRSALGIALSIFFLWWTLRGIDPAEIWHHLRQADGLALLAMMVVGTCIFPIRVPRWRVELDPVAERLPLLKLWRAIAIGMMGNNVFPARAGEVMRAYVISREAPQVPFSAAFASLAVDRLFDAFVVLLLMLVAMLDPAFPKGQLIGGRSVAQVMLLGGVVSLALFGALYLIVFFPQTIIGIYEALTRRVAPRLEKRGREMLLAFADGLGVLRHPGRFLLVLGWTIVHWLVNALAFYLGFLAFGVKAPFSAAVLLQGLIAVGIAVPSAPGFFGLFEKIGQAGLGLYGVDRALATSWAIGYHVLTFLPITGIGLYYFWRLGLHLRDVQAPAEVTAGAAEPVEEAG